MDDDVKKAFVDVNTAINNLSGNVMRLTESNANITKQISNNCAKLDKIIKHLGLE